MQKTAIVIPCYNEAERINKIAFEGFLTKNESSFFILFVNDGSTDATKDVLQELCNKHTINSSILNLEKNSGKAEAVRQGLLKAHEMNTFSYVAYFDADLATPLSELHLLQNIANQNTDLQIILCSRIKRLGAMVTRNRKRHLLGRIFSTFSSIILRLPVYDTQCGAKLLKTSIVPIVCNEPFLTSWLFDVEILARLRNQYPTTIKYLLYEHPVTKWEDVGGSKLRLKHMLKIPIELYRIHKKYNN